MNEESKTPEFHDFPIDLDNLFLRDLDARVLRKKAENEAGMNANIRRELLAVEKKVKEWSDKDNRCCPFSRLSDAAIKFLESRGFKTRRDLTTGTFMVSW